MRNPVESLEVPLAVGVGGALGSLARWGLATVIVDHTLPLATFITNISGCFALGVVLVVGEVLGHRQGHHHHRQKWWVRLWRPFTATGVLGGFTTFSTFSAEVVTNFSRGLWGWGVAQIGLHLAGSLLGTVAGLATLRAFK